jgi:cell division septum initiation protein DivIVA
MDSTTILAIAIVSLSAVLIVVGIYSVIILRQLHQTVKNVNRITGRIDSASELIDNHLIKPGTSIAGILTLLREGSKILNEAHEISTEAGPVIKIAAKEAKDIAKVVKEELAPTVTQEAKEVTHQIAAEEKDVIHEAASHSKDVVETAAAEGKSLVHAAATQGQDVLNQASSGAEEVVAAIRQPEPMKAGSLGTRRRFFSRKK